LEWCSANLRVPESVGIFSYPAFFPQIQGAADFGTNQGDEMRRARGGWFGKSSYQ
jgi:hypothetical protein